MRVSMSSPKTLGHTASDFEELTNDELEVVALHGRRKGFGVPALYRVAHAYVDGLRPGDIILSLDGQSFESTKDLNSYIRTKSEFDIAIEFLRGGKIYNLNTKLHSEQHLHEECRKVEDLWGEADFGEPYALPRVHRYLREAHWDFLGLDSRHQAQETAQARQRQLLAGLFGSSVCCIHLAFWTAPYRGLITHASIQKVLSNNYVSLLIMKPEAYRLYRQYQVDSKFPALLRMTWEGELEQYFSLEPDTKVSDVLSFLEKNEPRIVTRPG